MIKMKLITILLLFFSFKVHASFCDLLEHSSNELSVLQKAEINNNRFCLILDEDKEGIWTRYKVNKIIITDLNNKVIQNIVSQDNDYILADPDELLDIGDFNFDGKLDFYIFSSSGGISPNNTNTFYIYDKVSKIYNQNDFLSNLPQPMIDEKNKYIQSAFRDGCCNYVLERYNVINNKYVKFYTKNESLTNDGNYVEKTVGHLVNGKFRYKTTRTKAPKE